MTADSIDRAARAFLAGEDDPDAVDRAARAFLDSDEQLPPRRLGRYEIGREIGRGGMAVVYEAVDPELRRKVAVKVVHGRGLERMQREGAAIARLRHPNIVTVHEIGESYIVMEHVAGRTLGAAMSDKTPAERLRLLLQVADAIAHAHERGVIHRDLKPENILVEPDGRVVVTDFGLARALDVDNLTRSGTRLGTAHYMSPEQVRGDAAGLGPATDVWSLGILLYEAAAGRRPFDAPTLPALYDLIVREDPAPLPGDLGAVVAAALDKDPARRYPNAAALAADLRRVIEGQSPSVRRPGPVRRLAGAIRRRPARAAMLVALLALGTTAIATALGLRERSRSVAFLREQARVSLDAALELRRAGAVSRMRQFLPPLESAYRRALELAPRLAEVEYLMGRMHRALLDHAAARRYQERALAKEPRFAPALYERAVLLSMQRWHSGQPEDASSGPQPAIYDPIKQAWRAFLDTATRDPTAHAAVPAGGSAEAQRVAAEGLVAYYDGDLVKARALLERATRLDPQSEEGWEALSRVATADSRATLESEERALAQREELLEERIARDRGYFPFYQQRATIRGERAHLRRMHGADPTGDYAAYEAACSDVIRMAPERADGYACRADAHMARSTFLIARKQDARAELAAAEADASRALAIEPRLLRAIISRARTRFYRARELLDRGEDPRAELTAAIADFREAGRLSESPCATAVWRGRALTYQAVAAGRAGEDPLPIFAAGEAEHALCEGEPDPSGWIAIWRSELHLERARHLLANGQDPGADLDAADRDLAHVQAQARNNVDGWQRRAQLERLRGRHLETRGDRPGARRAYIAANAALLQMLSVNPGLAGSIGDDLREVQRKAALLEGR